MTLFEAIVNTKLLVYVGLTKTDLEVRKEHSRWLTSRGKNNGNRNVPVL